jgi:dienelactone hydrolase
MRVNESPFTIRAGSSRRRRGAGAARGQRGSRAALFIVMLRLAALCLVAPAALLAVRGLAADELPRGTLIESVNVEAARGQSYALYLPAGYTPEKRWPILYAFDPGGRGRVPVALFRAAAERYGYVVAGSNDSRNGLAPAAVGAIINALWKDTHARLSIDDARVYAAGFSGGARVANRLAATCGGCVAGVISSGAGFPPDIAPTATLPYAFFGTVGVDDFNFREMRPLERTLDALGVAARLVTFAGRHQWCPEEVCAEGLSWMELLAMRRGRRPKDDALIDAALARLAAPRV